MNSINVLIDISYLIAVILFIVGMKRLSHPDTARNGNLIAAAGMALAMLATFFVVGVGNYLWIIAAIALGSVVGYYIAIKAKMTQMPQLVSFYNGMGGASAALIGVVEYSISFDPNQLGQGITLMASIILGGIAFTGSIIAMGKLEGWVKDFKINTYLGFSFLVLSIGLAVYLLSIGQINVGLAIVLAVLGCLYGVAFVLPIGGADMPVVISLLNAFTGVTATTTGIIYDNNVMLMGGILVGSSGLILTILMAKAMNRTVANVLFSAWNTNTTAASADMGDKTVREISMNDAAILLSYAKKVCVVPGYGLAVAQAQQAMKELEKQMEEKGVEVKYGIHPVAGRMPGHMNVLLAEADVSYDKLIEMETINPDLPTTDVVVVIGANDVVNPSAIDDPASPIYGMPIIEANKAQNVIIIKRSMGSGYAGIDNPLFYDPKTRMLFGDAKKVLNALATEMKMV